MDSEASSSIPTAVVTLCPMHAGGESDTAINLAKSCSPLSFIEGAGRVRETSH